MRVVYFGSGTFSVPSLQALLAGSHEVVRVFTQPARPAGRGGKLKPTPIAETAAEAGVEVVETANINTEESVARIRAVKPELICVVDFGQLLRESVMASAPLGAMNLHASLLPELRGAAPVNWAIIRGHERTGVTTFRIVRAMDAGPIYLQQAADIGPEETAEDLLARLAELGSALVVETVDRLAEGTIEPIAQDDEQATLAPRLKKNDGVIDFAADAEAICRLVRGTWPWPGAQAGFRRAGGKAVPVTIAAAAPAEGEAGETPGELGPGLTVSAGRGRFAVRRLRPAGKRLMEWRDFVNGYRVQPGDRFVAVARR